MYKLLRPFLFRLSPERAHHLTFAALEMAKHIPGALALVGGERPSAEAAVEVMGLKFPGPVGLAAGMDLPSSVAPFILRGVCLLGIDSVMCPIELRRTAWSRLASDLDHGKLAEITHEIGLDEVIAAGAKILAGQVRGRIVVKIL